MCQSLTNAVASHESCCAADRLRSQKKIEELDWWSRRVNDRRSHLRVTPALPGAAEHHPTNGRRTRSGVHRGASASEGVAWVRQTRLDAPALQRVSTSMVESSNHRHFPHTIPNVAQAGSVRRSLSSNLVDRVGNHVTRSGPSAGRWLECRPIVRVRSWQLFDPQRDGRKSS